jgi:hypothetical protein
VDPKEIANLNRLMAGGSSEGRRVSDPLRSVTFDTSAYQDRGHRVRGQDRFWSTADGDPVFLVYDPRPPGFPKGARTTDEFRTGCSTMRRESGAEIVELGVRRTTPRPAVYAIFRNQYSGGRAWFGSLAFLFRDFSLTIQAVCQEQGTTGIRESTVAYLQNTVGDPLILPPPDPTHPPWDPDNRRFDRLIPDHALSRLRRILDRVAASVRIDDDILRLPGFSLPDCDM